MKNSTSPRYWRHYNALLSADPVEGNRGFMV